MKAFGRICEKACQTAGIPRQPHLINRMKPKKLQIRIYSPYSQITWYQTCTIAGIYRRRLATEPGRHFLQQADS
jgi:hypothetical protein